MRAHTQSQHTNPPAPPPLRVCAHLQSQRTKASVPLLQKAVRAILLTGTPALSKPIELMTLMQVWLWVVVVMWLWLRRDGTCREAPLWCSVQCVGAAFVKARGLRALQCRGTSAMSEGGG